MAKGANDAHTHTYTHHSPRRPEPKYPAKRQATQRRKGVLVVAILARGWDLGHSTPPAVGPCFRRNLISCGYGRGQNQTDVQTGLPFNRNPTSQHQPGLVARSRGPAKIRRHGATPFKAPRPQHDGPGGASTALRTANRVSHGARGQFSGPWLFSSFSTAEARTSNS